MGFDLHGWQPKNERGEYFRNNVWWWRRLADFVIHKTGCVDLTDQECWHYNDGHFVPKNVAEQIAKQLRYLIKTGEVRQFEFEVTRNQKIADATNEKVEALLDDIRKKAEKETGQERIAPREYPKHLKDEWDKAYEQKDHNANYPFNQKNVEEFIEFCENSGGFRIC